MNAAPLVKDFVRLSRDLTSELDHDCNLNGIDQLLLEKLHAGCPISIWSLEAEKCFIGFKRAVTTGTYT